MEFQEICGGCYGRGIHKDTGKECHECMNQTATAINIVSDEAYKRLDEFRSMIDDAILHIEEYQRQVYAECESAVIEAQNIIDSKI